MQLKNFKRSNLIIGFLDLLLIVFIVLDFGFEAREQFKTYKLIALPVILVLLFAFNLYKHYKFRFNSAIQKATRPSLVILTILIIAEAAILILNQQNVFIESFFRDHSIVELGLIFYYFIRLTFLMRYVYKLYFNPAILFIGSFLLIALCGTVLLLLPSATTNGISFTDALFSATSAVSVNGLMVVDIGEDFTIFGQSVLMGLFQIGGLGMLTFTSFFAYFFKSGGSVKESLFMSDMLGDDELNNILKITMRVVIFSLAIEAIGAFLIYNSTAHTVENPGFFAAYHAISAYSNAGFTLHSGGLQGEGMQFNYYLQWILMALVVFGGLGFSIAHNFVHYMRQFFINLFFKRKRKFISRVITLNTKIVVYTTALLIFGGTMFFLFSEYQAGISEHDTWFGKFTTAAFSSITARTAGFTTDSYTNFTIPGLLVTMFLMWVGASPGSTGGGIKTTTFALATMNVFSIARNKSHIEIGTRRVDYSTVRRAFAIIIVSLIAIGVGIVFLLMLNPEFTLLQIAFESFGAYSTSGMSLGITPDLTEGSKYIVMFLIFFGRIGLLNLMIGILKKVKTKEYKYPKENIFIN